MFSASSWERRHHQAQGTGHGCSQLEEGVGGFLGWRPPGHPWEPPTGTGPSLQAPHLIACPQQAHENVGPVHPPERGTLQPKRPGPLCTFQATQDLPSAHQPSPRPSPPTPTATHPTHAQLGTYPALPSTQRASQIPVHSVSLRCPSQDSPDTRAKVLPSPPLPHPPHLHLTVPHPALTLPIKYLTICNG